MAQVIRCYCLTCEQEVGQYRNSWDVYGSNYYSPLHPILSYEAGFIGAGEVRQTNFGSQNTTCYLQDVVCKNCRTFLGIRCHDAPEGHILKKNQHLLRLAHMSCVIDGTNKGATISVVDKIPLTMDGAAKKTQKPKSSRAPTAQPSTRWESQFAHPESAKCGFTNGYMMPPPAPPVKISAPKVSEFEVWARKAIAGQEQDITRISDAVQRIEETMTSVQTLLHEMQRGQTQHDQRLKQNTSNFVAIRVEAGALENQLKSAEQRSATSIDNLKSSFGQTLDSFAEDIGRMCPKPGDIDVLKAEVEQLKAKLKEVEAISLRCVRDAAPLPDLRSTLQSKLNMSTMQRGNVRVEISPMREGHLMNTTFYENAPTFSSMAGHSSSYQVDLDSSRKRKRHAKEDVSHEESRVHPPSFDPNPPTKSTRVSDRPAAVESHYPDIPPRQPQTKAAKQQIIEIESDKEPSPSFAPTRRDGTLDTEVNEEPPPASIIPRTATSDLLQASRTTRRSSIMYQDPSTPQTASFSHRSIYANRDASGALLTTTGKVDGRSLRHRRSFLGNKENEAPASERQGDRLRKQLQPQETKSLRKYDAPQLVPRCAGPKGPVEEHGLFESIERDLPGGGN